MLTKIKKLFVLVMFAAFAFVLVGCGGGIKGALKDITLPAEVTEDFTLSNVAVEGAVTTWTSNSDAIVIDGNYAEVFRPSGTDAEVTLTATVTLGEQTVTKDFVVVVKCLSAPDAIKINTGSLIAGENGIFYISKGQEVQLEIEVEDDGMSTEVTWSSKSKKRAEVTADGVLKGLELGSTTITATSTSNPNATASFELEVVEDSNPMKVLLNNKNYIENEIPRFITETYMFPAPYNKDVEAVYTDSLGGVLEGGWYVYAEGVDRQETIYCALTYKGQLTEFEFIISVVANAEDNEFLALDYAEQELDKIFKGYVGTGDKIGADIVVPEEFSAVDAMYDVTLSYDVVTDYQPLPIKFAAVGEEGSEVYTAVYTKPNDDANVRVEIYCRTANVDKVIRYNVVAAGYTQEEKIQYLKENVLPQANADGLYKLVCSHVTLPTGDTTGKFGALSIEWTSSDESVITSAGKFANPNLASEASVTLTAKITYKGTVNDSFKFEDTISYEYAVFPAENEAQSVALQVSNYIDAPEFLDQIKYFPYGDKERGTNVLPLPRTVGEIAPDMDAKYLDLEIVWGSSEEGLISSDFELLKQYLRYHEAVLTYTITIDGASATNEVVINVGITKVKNTIYIGGNFVYYQTGGGNNSGDVLCSLSKFDSPVGVVGANGKIWGFSYNNGYFNGLTWYIDLTDDEGVTTRYQYFAATGGYMTLDDQYNIDLTDPKNPVITLNEELNANIGTNYGGNWASVYYNASDKDVKVPMSPYTGGSSPFVDEAGVAIPWTAHPNAKSNIIDRENAFGMDGYRVGFVTDATGKVVFGNGESQIQNICDLNGNGVMDEADYWITIPAGGYAYTPKTQQNNAAIVGKFCVKDIQLTFETFEAYIDDEVGTFTHE